MECTQSSSDIIQTLWIGPPTKFLHLMVNSFLAHGHTVHLYCYENLNTNAKENGWAIISQDSYYEDRTFFDSCVCPSCIEKIKKQVLSRKS